MHLLRVFLLAIAVYYLDAIWQPANYDRRQTLAYSGFLFAAWQVIRHQGHPNRAAAIGLGLGIAAFFEIQMNRQEHQVTQDFNHEFNL